MMFSAQPSREEQARILSAFHGVEILDEFTTVTVVEEITKEDFIEQARIASHQRARLAVSSRVARGFIAAGNSEAAVAVVHAMQADKPMAPVLGAIFSDNKS